VLQGILRADPDNEEGRQLQDDVALLMQSEEFVGAGAIPEAICMLEDLQERRPGWLPVLRRLAAVHYEAAEKDGEEAPDHARAAVEAYRALLERDPTSDAVVSSLANALGRHAWLLRKSGSVPAAEAAFAEAVEVCDEALARNPDSGDLRCRLKNALIGQSHMLYTLERWADSVEVLGRALPLTRHFMAASKGKNNEWHWGLREELLSGLQRRAGCYRELGDVTLAAADLREVRKLDPEGEFIWGRQKNLVCNFLFLGAWADAASEAKRYRKDDPEALLCLCPRLLAALGADDEDAFREDLAHMWGLPVEGPATPIAHQTLLKFACLLPDSGIGPAQMMARLGRLPPDEPQESREFLSGIVALRSGSAGRAVEALERALDLGYRDQGLNLLFLAIAFAKLARDAEAHACLAEAELYLECDRIEASGQPPGKRFHVARESRRILRREAETKVMSLTAAHIMR
jgi:tetratricopeptide (TPR) repeat protein